MCIVLVTNQINRIHYLLTGAVRKTLFMYESIVHFLFFRCNKIVDIYRNILWYQNYVKELPIYRLIICIHPSCNDMICIYLSLKDLFLGYVWLGHCHKEDDLLQNIIWLYCTLFMMVTHNNHECFLKIFLLLSKQSCKAHWTIFGFKWS